MVLCIIAKIIETNMHLYQITSYQIYIKNIEISRTIVHTLPSSTLQFSTDNCFQYCALGLFDEKHKSDQPYNTTTMLEVQQNEA